jgi:hypothetical protein
VSRGNLHNILRRYIKQIALGSVPDGALAMTAFYYSLGCRAGRSVEKPLARSLLIIGRKIRRLESRLRLMTNYQLVIARSRMK